MTQCQPQTTLPPANQFALGRDAGQVGTTICIHARASGAVSWELSNISGLTLGMNHASSTSSLTEFPAAPMCSLT